jgi:hypothetical protein
MKLFTGSKKLLPCFFIVVSAASIFSSQIESFFQSYNQLTTIAGKGGNGDAVVNEWNTSFEGKPAIEAVLSEPHFSMADSLGNVYIADKNAHAIRKVDLSGIITTVAGTSVAGDGSDGKATETAISSPNGLWVSKAGVLYILDLGNSKIRKVAVNGLMTTVFKDDSGFGLGRALWVSKTEDTIWYASTNSIRRWTQGGGISYCAGGFSALGNITQDKNGYVIATDRSANLVYRIGPDTTKTIIAGNGLTSGGGDGLPALQTGLYGVRAVWFLDDNSYFLATHEGSQVWYVNTSGIAYIFLNGAKGNKNHTGDGENYRMAGYKISEVRSVTVDWQGNVIVTENDKGYIRKVSKRNLSIFKQQHDLVHPNNLFITSFSDKLNLRFNNSESEKASIIFVDQLGRNVKPQMEYEIKNSTHQIRICKSTISRGVYLIRIETRTKSFTKTIVIN